MKMIMASDLHGAVGIDNKLPWKLPVDLARFKKITEGSTIIMGWNTWKSLPGMLPDRHHVILTTKKIVIKSPDATIYNSTQEILGKYAHDDNAFVIGGPMVCDIFEPYCTDLYLTKVLATVAADRYWTPSKLWNLYDHEYAHDQQYDMIFCHFKR